MKNHKNKVMLYSIIQWVTSSKILFIVLFLLITGISSCKKFVQVDPPSTAISGPTVYSNNASASAAMTSVYANMISNYGPGYLSSGSGSISYLMGLASDELINYAPDQTTNVQFYENALSSNTGGAPNYYFWQELYQEIHVCNAIIEGVDKSTGVTPSIKQQIIGEAKFMRGFLLFYATNLYGEVPLVTSTDVKVNNTIRRSPVADVYQQVIGDLLDAQTKLSDNFLDASGNISLLRVRPNKVAATALLARVYLYQQKWSDVESQASMVINNANYNLAHNPDSVFLANSNEAIWQLQSILPGYNTFDGPSFVLTADPGSGAFYVSLSSNVVNAFEPGDIRRTHWVGTYASDGKNYFYPYKYKIGGASDDSRPVTEYTMVLRLAEQYLIRAEARAQGAGSGINGAISDLNVIRRRAGLPDYAGPTDKSSVIAAILRERRVELFSEWGHRWFDLKRTNNLDATMGAPGNVCQSKGGTWASYKALLPLPLLETQINPNLTQNPNY